MTFFIFAGDMLVMLFMVCVVVWLIYQSPDQSINFTARIPLNDENSNIDPVSRKSGE